MTQSNTATTVSERKERQQYLELLTGSGIEIGALHRPCYVPNLNVKYVDRLTKADLYKCYPELANLPIVNTDIIDDAESLQHISDSSQDFVIANHVIEHMANPIKALLNWSRVLKPGGKLFLAVPDKHHTFDINREITPLQHLISDYADPSAKRDYEHFVDFALKVSCQTFKVRPESEYQTFAKELWDQQYSIHYHVWDKPAFHNFLSHIEATFLQWQMGLVAQMPTVQDEFIYVLGKQHGQKIADTPTKSDSIISKFSNLYRKLLRMRSNN